MKLFSIQIIYCLIFLGFVGCSEDDKTESSIINTQSTSIRNAPAFFPNGTVIELNPTITFTSDLKVETGATASARYSNSDRFSSFTEENNSQDVTLTLSEVFNDEIAITFSVLDRADNNISKLTEIVLSQFTDLGNDGFYDEFKVRATVSNNSVSVGKIGVSGNSTDNLRTWSGRFIGSAKPRNPTVVSSLDVRRAPTEEEFDLLIVGKSLYYHIEEANEVGFIEFEDSGLGTLRYYQNTAHTDANITGHTHQIRWLYKYLKGEPELSIKTKEDGEHYRKFKLSFTDFYEGTLTEMEGFDFEEGSNFDLHSGIFRFNNGIVFTWDHDYTRHD
jgi:hypothetical protein